MLKKIELIQGIGLFYNANGKPHTFDKATLIYAENGRGKSTLANILRSVATNNPSLLSGRTTLDGSHAPKCLLNFDSGHKVKYEDGVWSEKWPELLVFDADFIEKNVHSGGEVNTHHRKNLLEFALVEQEDGETVYEWQARVIEGRYRLLFRMLKDVVTMKGKESWNDLTDTEKVELTEAMLTLVMFILGALSAGALFGDDDDDENKKLYYRIIENISQQYNFIDWLRSVKNAPATIAKLWDFSTGLSTLFLSLPGGIVGDKDSFNHCLSP